jgi:hypothetical protein
MLAGFDNLRSERKIISVEEEVKAAIFFSCLPQLVEIFSELQFCEHIEIAGKTSSCTALGEVHFLVLFVSDHLAGGQGVVVQDVKRDVLNDIEVNPSISSLGVCFDS